MGSGAAYHLAVRGEPILLLDQFAPGHDRGSSHGLARITRHAYADLAYAERMLDAFRAWREFEAEAGETVYFRTGGVTLCPDQVDYVERIATNLDTLGVPFTHLSPAALQRAYPAFQVSADHEAVFEPDAGLLAASRIVALQVELARHHGALVRTGCRVDRIDLETTHPTLVAGSERIAARRLIVTAGAWVSTLFPALASTLTPTRQQVLYFAPADRSAVSIGRLPVWIYQGRETGEAFYGMPDFLGSGAKAARHSGPVCDPNRPNPVVAASYIADIRRFLAGVLPILAEAPLCHAEVCLYTNAPDDQFMIGPLPGRPDVIVASPCSGHGFKFSNLIGRMLADLAMTGQSDTRLGRGLNVASRLD
jgi:sarcosine oxidase